MVNFDKASTSQPYIEVIEAVMPYLTTEYGNPSSNYELGRKAKKAIEESRKTIAEYLGVKSEEIYFTSSSSESNQLAIKGYSEANNCDLITTTIEHIDVLMCANTLQTEVFICKVDKYGVIDLNELESYCKKRYKPLVAINLVNNEIGTIQPLDKISQIVHDNGGCLYVDATQAINKIKIDMNKVDMIGFGGHKIHALRGVGVLYIKEGIEIKPLIYGHQERGKIGRTENTAAIVSLSKAIQLHKEEDNEYIEKIRNEFERKLLEEIPKVYINKSKDRVGNISNVCFQGIEARTLQTMLDLEDIYVSTGSACNSTIIEPSHVLKAIGITEPDIYSCIRFSFDKHNTIEEVNLVIDKIREIISLIKFI